MVSRQRKNLDSYMVVRPDLDKVSRITLDRDYSGEVAERRILRRLLELIRRDQPNFKGSVLRMDMIAGSRADTIAREVYRGLRQADGEILASEIEAVIWQE